MSREFDTWPSFISRLGERLKEPLPGLEAHRRLVPPERRPDLGKEFPENRKVAAVLSLIYPLEGRVHTALIRRPSYPGVHGGQIAFPGGKVEESDRDLLHTALREAEEEVGIPQDHPNDSLELTRLYIPPSRFEVIPFLAHVEERPTFIRQEAEVEEIIELPLADLLDESLFREAEMKTSRGTFMVPAYHWNNEIIWGATAMVLAEMADIMKDLLDSRGFNS